MRRKTIVTLFVVLFIVGLTGIVTAGVLPSPFMPLINELNSVVNVLSAEDTRLSAVLSAPPDDQQPEGLVGKLDAMAKVLSVQNDRVNAVLGSPPDDGIPPPEFLGALGNVKDKAGSIADQVEEVLGAPPDDQRVRDALEAVGDNAQAIVDTVDEYLAGIGPSPIEP